MPVAVLGLSEPASAGDELRVTSDLSIARTIGEARAQRARFAGFMDRCQVWRVVHVLRTSSSRSSVVRTATLTFDLEGRRARKPRKQ